jgi:hypothetical protein
MVPILDTLFCSVFLWMRRYKEGEKIMRGEGYTDCWEKVWGWPPITIGEPGAGQAAAGVHSQLICYRTVAFTFSSIGLAF